MASLLILIALTAACTSVESAMLRLKTVGQCFVPRNEVFDFTGLTEVPGPHNQNLFNGSFFVPQTFNHLLKVNLNIIATSEQNEESSWEYKEAFEFCEELKDKAQLLTNTEGLMSLDSGIEGCPIVVGKYNIRNVPFREPYNSAVVAGTTYNITMTLSTADQQETCLILVLEGY